MEWIQFKQVVADIAELPPEQREAELQQRCGGDADALARARELLRSITEAGDFLSEPLVAAPELAGEVLGPYRVHELIARGGQGSVYRAEHDRTGQTVALKVMRASLGGGDWERRFEHEVQVLGQLRHPAIAQIHDAGVARDADGRRAAFFAMEFVDGAGLLAFAERRQLSLRQRIKLMLGVCEGVQHAHQRGVTHRDLKPDNILVTDAGHAKIVDFGVALASGAEGPATTRMTQAGQIIGTLAYMSPEQVSGDPDAVDIRADVYALGVILFELLTGARPYDLDGVALPQALRVIQEHEPRRMSTFERRCAGDLETIVQVAMAKDPARRYGSASELAGDLRRYLNDEPVTARPATALYQLSKFVRRHRGLAAGMGLALLALLVGFGTTLWAMLDARAAEADSRDVAAYLEGMVASANVDTAGKNMTVIELLDAHAPKIDTAFAGRPHLRARLHSATGSDYLSLGSYERAAQHLESAVTLRRSLAGADAEETIAEENRYHQALIWTDRLDDAERLTAETLERATRALGAEHPETLAARAHRAYLALTRRDLEQAEAAYRELLPTQRRVLGERDQQTTTSKISLVHVLFERAEFEQAAGLLDEVLEVYEELHGPQHSKTLVVLTDVAYCQRERGHLEEAIATYERLLELGEEVWGAEHPSLWTAMGGYAGVLGDVGRYADAARISREVVAKCRAALGPRHVDTLIALNNLCVNLLQLEEWPEAVLHCEELVAASKEVRGLDNLTTAQAMATYGTALHSLGETQDGDAQRESYAAATENMLAGLDVMSRVQGEDHPMTLIQRNNFGRAQQSMGDLAGAVATLSAVVAAWTEHHGDAQEVQRVFRWNLARVLQAAKRFADAEREFDAALALPAHPAADDRRILEHLMEYYQDRALPERVAEIKRRLAQLEP